LNRLCWLLFACLPHHLISRIAFYASHLRTPLNRPVIRWFIRRYGVVMADAEEPDPAAYSTFNTFFTRALRVGTRPLAGDDTTLVAPVDGRVSQAGSIAAGTLVQAKGIDYTTAALLGDAPSAATFDSGRFATLYLAPGDYHRIHMPLTGRLRRMIHVPGRLYSVAPGAVATIDGLFTRNERVCALFDTDYGRMAVILVGALNVGALDTVWAGPITPPRGRRVGVTDYATDPGLTLQRGAEMGRFNLGSTVIVLVDRPVTWTAAIEPGNRVRVGSAMAPILPE